jgi:hypothetical protein
LDQAQPKGIRPKVVIVIKSAFVGCYSPPALLSLDDLLAADRTVTPLG